MRIDQHFLAGLRLKAKAGRTGTHKQPCGRGDLLPPRLVNWGKGASHAGRYGLKAGPWEGLRRHCTDRANSGLRDRVRCDFHEPLALAARSHGMGLGVGLGVGLLEMQVDGRRVDQFDDLVLDASFRQL